MSTWRGLTCDTMSKRCVSASAGHRGQQTLFDCVKRKESFDDGDDSASVGPSTTQGQTSSRVTS